MRSKFEEQLRNLNREMIDMGIMIENSIKESVEALNNGWFIKKFMLKVICSEIKVVS